MPSLTEQSRTQIPDYLREEQASPAQRALGRVALHDIEVSAGHFYDGDPFVGKTIEGEHRLIVKGETVGAGRDVESALHNAWDRMRSRETVQTPSLARIEMTKTGAFVDFTKLENYAPKMAPSSESYPVPEYLDDLLMSSIYYGGDTYRKTIEQEGWQAKLRSLAEDYIQNNPDGKKLAEGLGIRSLSHLTPMQAVKFSTTFVQNVSKYERDAAGKPAGERADKLTTYQLLREGIDRKNDPAWPGNGVCRNVACNVKAVFEALKDTQAEMSMLRNTYCAYDGGADGAGYDDKRADDDFLTTHVGPDTRKHDGHVWNRFVTVDKNGSATVAILDATWALDQDIDAAFDHMDYTEFRATPEIIETFKRSESQVEAFDDLTDHIKRTLTYTTGAGSRLHPSRREQMKGYVMTEYLEVARSFLKSSEGVSEYYFLPEAVVTQALKLRAVLNPAEIETLFTLDVAGQGKGMERERIGKIIAGFDKDGNKGIGDSHKADRIIFRDNDLQMLVYEAIDEPRLQHLAGVNGKFRARLRDLCPEKLPPFDPSTRKEDLQELRHFASMNNISGWSAPEMIMREFKDRLKRLAGDDAVYDAITVGRTDYDLAKNFYSITQALRSRK